jgi:uncharacterized metal-binding protein YceD (DUF177 family)
MTDRFAQGLRIDRIGDGERLDLVAGEAQRRLVAERLGLSGLDRLEAHVTLSRTGPLVRAEGRIAAALEQRCVISGEPVRVHVDEAFALLFMPEPEVARAEEEIELGEKDCDVVFYDGGAIDLGDAIADTLALSLDAYPRSAGAEAALKEAGVLTQEQASPFAALAGLKGRKSED